MSNDILIYLCFGVILAVLFALMLAKDSQTSKKFAKFEIILESLIRENYELKKELKNIDIHPAPSEPLDMQEVARSIEFSVNEAVNAKVIPIIESLKAMENAIGSFKDDQQNRMYNLEERTRTINKLTPPDFDIEENRIVELYNSGKSIESIARDLRLSVGRVSMVLKVHKVI